jgi:cell division protein FtsW
MLQRQIGYVMLVVVLGLAALGMIMIFSTSGRFAPEGSATMYSYAKKQAIWVGVGLVLLIAVSRLDYHELLKASWWLVGATALLLALCYVPHIGKMVNGARRWLQVGPMTLQPSELAKIAMVIFLAHWLSLHQRKMHEFWRGFGIPSAVVGGLCLLIVLEIDLGMTFLCGIVFLIVMFCGGARWRYIGPLAAAGPLGLLLVAILMPERQGRFLAFLDVEKYKQGDGLQAYQALIALGSGGMDGLGLGESRQKMFYLPEAHTDFIFPIIGEELGMWVALTVVFGYLLLVLCGGWISLHAPDPAGVMLGLGLTSILGLQAVMNLAVVMSLMPNKGLPLPFVSYGGSNLLMCMTAMGILFNLHRQGLNDENKSEEALPSRPTVRM